ncbi:MAG: hypothetical protein O7E57_09885 [Gammaproteobacteria bacterium]|nr:hypothetical protein [Gammaproteobacteria bacterium]
MALLLGLVPAGCTTAIGAPAGIEVDKDVTFPITIEKVWYRTKKVRLFGKAYEASGKLAISETEVEFTHKKGRIRIPGDSMRRVIRGKLSPDITNEWVIVHYAEEGNEEVAAFKGALFAGDEVDAQIYSAVVHLLEAN